MAHARTRPAALRMLMALLLVQGLGGLAGGISLVAAPDGRIMKMPVSLLDGSPFHDFLVPGLILGIVLGVLPLVVLTALFVRPWWGWFGAGIVGIGLIIWLVVESTIIGYAGLQVVFGLVGIGITVLALLPSVRAFCGIGTSR